MASALQQMFLASGGAPGQGTLAGVEGADSAAFTAFLMVQGTLAATDGADTAAFESLTAFQGALVKKSADHTAANYNFTVITWNAEEFDTDGIHDTVTDNSRFTIPSALNGKYGIFRVNIHLSSVSASQTAAVYLHKDGAAAFDGWGGESHANGAFGDVYTSVRSQVVPLATGAYFEAVLYCSDTSVTLESEDSSFSLEVVG